MMAARLPDATLVCRLPSVRGRYIENVDLSGSTWFRAGGSADVVFRPAGRTVLDGLSADTADLAAFLTACPGDVPRTVLGLGSNLLIRDGGVRGVIIRLDKSFSGIEVDGTTVTAGAGALDVNLARVCRDAGRRCAHAGCDSAAALPASEKGGQHVGAVAQGPAKAPCGLH